MKSIECMSCIYKLVDQALACSNAIDIDAGKKVLIKSHLSNALGWICDVDESDVINKDCIEDAISDYASEYPEDMIPQDRHEWIERSYRYALDMAIDGNPKAIDCAISEAAEEMVSVGK